MNKFTTILWDVDGTLLDFLYAQRSCMINCFKQMNIPITEEMLKRYSEINDVYWKKLELGLVTKDELLIGRFRDFILEFKIAGARPEVLKDLYEDGLGKVYKYQENSYEICRNLFGRIKQYIITNGVASAQRGKIALSGMDRFMEELFISEEIGVPKPQREFFDYCMKHIDEKDKDRILIVGDSLTSDIKGGILYGISTCWYRPDGTVNDSGYKPDYEINTLSGIYDILGL